MNIQMHDYDRYFFNDLYDDELIRNKVHDWQTRLYSDILDGKAWYQNNRVINGDSFDFKVDDTLNLLHGFAVGTYSLSLTVSIVPFYSELEFFRKYGYGETISTMDIMKDNKVFNKNIFFYINGYLVHDAKIKIWRDYSLIFVEPSTEYDKDELDDILHDNNGDDTWTLYFTTKSDYYLTTKSRAMLFDGNKVYLSNFTESRKYNKPLKYNSWNMYVSTGSSYNLMTATSTKLEEDEKGEYFIISDEFKTLIKERAATLRCLVVNEPECTGQGTYINTEDSQAIFQIPFEKNPIPQRNLVIWEYDHETGRKMHPLVPSVKMYYPNIYDFEEMMQQAYLVYLYTSSQQLVRDKDGVPIVFGSSKVDPPVYDLYVEWIEPMDDASAYDSYIQDYIDCYKEDYASMRVYDELPEPIKSFSVLDGFGGTPFEYFSSEYKGDFRAWRLSKIREILKDNPKRYDVLFDRLFYKAKKYINKSYSIDSTPEVYERSVMSTREFCHEAQDILVNFKEPHSYILVYYYQGEKRPVFLWFNGKYTRPTTVLKYGTDLYAFFPTSLLEDNPVIEMEVELIDEPIVTKTFGFSRLNSTYDLEKCELHRNIALDNFIVTSASDDSYVNKDYFAFKVQIHRKQIEYIGSDKVDWIDEVYDYEALYDNSEELIIPSDFDFIMLGSSEISVQLSPSAGNCQKRINPDNVLIMPAKPDGAITTILNKRFHIHSTDFYTQRIFNVTDEYLTTYEFSDFKGSPSKKYFMIFASGIYVNPEDYTIDFNGYNQTAVFTFRDNKYNAGTTMEILYMGYATEVLYNGKISDIQYQDDIIYFEGLSRYPFNCRTHRIYIDGYRIPSDRVKLLGQGNMIMIDQITNDDQRNIVILEQKHDDDSFEYSGSQFLDKVSKDDPIFRQYLKEKYND